MVFRYARVLRIRFGSNSGASNNAGWKQIKMPGMSDSFLVPILSAFQLVKSAEWMVESPDPCPQIIDALSTLPGLTTLILHFNGSPFHDFSLIKLDYLQQLSISNTKDARFTEDLFTQISQYMETKATLTHISIETTAPGLRFPFPAQPRPPAPASIEAADAPPDSVIDAAAAPAASPLTQQTTPSSPIQFLRIHGCGFRFKSRPQLSTLTTLEIYHNQIPTNASIWTILQSANVKLKRIVVDSVPLPLIAYLKSYAGLEKLAISVPAASRNHHNHEWEWEHMNGHVDRSDFYEKVIGRHHDTLESLSLYKFSPVGDWDAQMDADVETLLRCSRLSTLSIDFDVSDLSKVSMRLSNLLSTALQFDDLRLLAINWVTTQNKDISLERWGLERNIVEYHIPRQAVFKISTGLNLFEPKVKGDGKRRWQQVTIKAGGDIAMGLGWVL
ncbi:hypothetical protein EST38_g2145 [Candolleomyces aberdarensis]|uniref:Uncharacterized protein n=1 Tax=Candolleomyces aberdarensis TaxID=2316362 RepID=A0A4Q2DT42_9AGAR|nr:hypothetical protein EST38_g2145 [Candolleomyces aberdarensis]